MGLLVHARRYLAGIEHRTGTRMTTARDKAFYGAGSLLFMVISSLVAFHAYTGSYDDFPSFYWAASLALHDGVSPYQYQHFAALSETLGSKVYPFLYPPPSVLLFSPLLLCKSYAQAKLLFVGLNLLASWCLLVCLYGLYRHYGGRYGSVAYLCLAVLLSLYTPLFETFRAGQVNLLVLMCLLPLFIRSKTAVQAWLAGSLLGLAIVLKVYVILLLPVLLVFGWWRECLASLVVLLVLVCAGLPVLPETLWPDWLALANQSGFGQRVANVLTLPFNQSINGFFMRMAAGQDETIGHASVVMAYGVAGALLLLVAALVSRWLVYREDGGAIAVALVLLLLNLVAPLTWSHHYVLALPAVVWLGLFFEQAVLLRWQRYSLLMVGLPALAGLALPVLPLWLLGAWHDAVAVGHGIPLAQNLQLSSSLLMGIAVLTVLAILVITGTGKPSVGRVNTS